jgi:trigger factor
MSEETNPQQPAPNTTDQDSPTPPADAQPTDAAEQLPDNVVDVQDAGTLKKKVSITISRQRIDAKLGEMYGELSNTAQVPGFRVGHAPRRLIEKRFGKEVSQDVRNSLVGEAIGQAIEKAALKTIGEPDLKLDEIALPDKGELTFAFEVEVMPEFELPSVEGVAIRKPKIEIGDDRVDKQLDQWAQMRATYEPADDAANDGDIVVADTKVTPEGQGEVTGSAVTLRVAAGQVEGIPLVDLGKSLAGKKAGESASLTVTVPDAHPNEAWRGKQAAIEIKVNEVRHRKLPQINDEFAQGMGFDNMAALREAVRARMTAGIESEAKGVMRSQAEQYLLDNTKLDVPPNAAARHTAELLSRRYVDLLYQGVPRERIDEHLTELQAAAAEQAQRDMKLRFILARIIEKQDINTDDSEVNSRIAAMARQYDRRPERLRQELESEGRLEEVAISIREEKALDFVLSKAQVTEVTEEQMKAETEARKAAEEARKAEEAKKNESAGEAKPQ